MIYVMVILFCICLLGLAKLMLEMFMLCERLRNVNAKKQHESKWEKIFADVYGD